MTDIEARIRAKLALPKNFRVTTHYADGATRIHDVHAEGQATNWAAGESQKIGRDLIDRDTGKTVRVVDVTISSLGA